MSGAAALIDAFPNGANNVKAKPSPVYSRTKLLVMPPSWLRIGAGVAGSATRTCAATVKLPSVLSQLLPVSMKDSSSSNTPSGGASRAASRMPPPAAASPHGSPAGSGSTAPAGTGRPKSGVPSSFQANAWAKIARSSQPSPGLVLAW